MKKIILLFFGSLLFVNICLSQDSIPSFKYPLDIVITGSRLELPLKFNTFSTSVVEKDFLRTMPKTICVDEPLKLVPGVRVENQADGSRIHLSIRGQGILSEHGIRGTKVLLDGIPLNDPSGFTPDFYDVDWETVSKIEVLKGTGGSLYGGSGSAGIINITTEDGFKKPFGVDGLFKYGTNNFWKGFFEFGGTADKVNYRVSSSRIMGDGYRDHTHFWGNNLYGKFNYQPVQNIKLTPILYYTDFYNENPEGINLEQYRVDPKQPNPDAIPFNEYMETNRFTAGLTGKMDFEKNHFIDFNIYGKRTRYTEVNNRTFLRRILTTPGGSLQYTYSFGNKLVKNHISLGTDLQWQTISERRTDNLYSYEGDTVRSQETIKQSTLSAFLIDRLEINSKFNVTGSVRYDRIKNELQDELKLGGIDLSGNKDFDKTTAKIGFTYSPFTYLNFYGNYGTGFMPPAIEELAQNPVRFGGFNDALVPATSFGPEFGVRGVIADKIYYDITGFYLKTENDFNRYRISDPLRNQETFYQNIGKSNRLGLEFYTKIVPIRFLTLQIAYTFSDFKYSLDAPFRVLMDDTSIVKYVQDGNYLPNVPQHQLYIDLQIEPIKNLYFGISTETASKWYIDGANIEEEAANGYTLTHLRANYVFNIKGIYGELQFSVRNLFDKIYLGFTEPDPGGNSYQPAARREIFGGLKINF